MPNLTAPTVTEAVAAVSALLGVDVTPTTTGGGCTALIATLPDGAQVWITDVTGCHATPDPSDHSDRDAWMVGYYADEDAAAYGEGAVIESDRGACDVPALLSLVRRALVGTGPTFDVCGACACLIANGDASGDEDEGEARTAALGAILTRNGAAHPVVACPTDEDGDHGHGFTSDACDVCGESDEWGVLHRVVTDPAILA